MLATRQDLRQEMLADRGSHMQMSKNSGLGASQNAPIQLPAKHAMTTPLNVNLLNAVESAKTAPKDQSEMDSPR